MSATYDQTLSTLKDHVRLALGDVPSNQVSGAVDDPLLQDETIAAKLDAFGYCEALAQLAEGLITLIGQRPSSYDETGGLSLGWSERINSWRNIVEAARSGRMRPPTESRRFRPYAAVGQTTAQEKVGRPYMPAEPPELTDQAFRPD